MSQRPDDALVANAADAAQVKEARKRERSADELWAADLQALAATNEGKRVLRRLLKQCGVWESGLGASDALTNFYAGRRDVGLFLIAEIMTHAPASLSTIILQETNA